jgi:cell division protein FtsL
MEKWLYWLMVFTVVFVVAIIYLEFKTTTYRSPDGSCQSLTIEDDCD